MNFMATRHSGSCLRGLITTWCFTLLFACSWQLPGASAQTDTVATDAGDLKIIPIQHATFSLQWSGKTILVDPVGGADPFAKLPKPDLILITDIHGDHLNKDTLAAVIASGTSLVTSPAAAEQLPAEIRSRAKPLANGEATEVQGVKIQAIPAYNLTADRLKYHPKGRGNGYVLTLGSKRVYISGDTENIPEMLALKNIDLAFLCMNLPYTMTVEQAAEAVRAFKPKIVYPYHSRGSDLQKFVSLVGENAGVEVRIRDWYK